MIQAIPQVCSEPQEKPQGNLLFRFQDLINRMFAQLGRFSEENQSRVQTLKKNTASPLPMQQISKKNQEIGALFLELPPF